MARRSRKSTTPAPPEKAGPGRPPIEIDLADLEKLAALQCTQEEAAAWFGCSVATINNRLSEDKYRERWEAGRGKGRVSLRRYQFKMAENNPTMAIWLGKQWLGQSDKIVYEGGDLPVKFTLKLADDGDNEAEGAATDP